MLGEKIVHTQQELKDTRNLIGDLKYDIAKFLFDKGNDVFNDYSVEYEFSAVHKRLLLEKFLKESLSSPLKACC